MHESSKNSNQNFTWENIRERMNWKTQGWWSDNVIVGLTEIGCEVMN
jgi:hypothetical protein